MRWRFFYGRAKTMEIIKNTRSPVDRPNFPRMNLSSSIPDRGICICIYVCIEEQHLLLNFHFVEQTGRKSIFESIVYRSTPIKILQPIPFPSESFSSWIDESYFDRLSPPFFFLSYPFFRWYDWLDFEVKRDSILKNEIFWILHAFRNCNL